MKKLILIFLLSIILNANFAILAKDTIDGSYDDIYENLHVLDFSYDENIDPDESTDYGQYMQSPYPLIKLSEKLQVKNITIDPGFYLLTPRNVNGIDFIMFKQYGKIIALVPVFEKKEVILKDETKSKTKTPLYKKPYEASKKSLFNIIKPHLKPPAMPAYKLDTAYVESGRFFEMWLYVDNIVYKTLYKIPKKLK